MVYLIHFNKPYKHAKHYLGFTKNKDFQQRLDSHKNGTGARLLSVLNENGIDYKVVRTWPEGDRTFERSLKKKKNTPRLCPVCTNGTIT